MASKVAPAPAPSPAPLVILEGGALPADMVRLQPLHLEPVSLTMMQSVIVSEVVQEWLNVVDAQNKGKVKGAGGLKKHYAVLDLDVSANPDRGSPGKVVTGVTIRAAINSVLEPGPGVQLKMYTKADPTAADVRRFMDTLKYPKNAKLF